MKSKIFSSVLNLALMGMNGLRRFLVAGVAQVNGEVDKLTDGKKTAAKKKPQVTTNFTCKQ